MMPGVTVAEFRSAPPDEPRLGSDGGCPRPARSGPHFIEWATGSVLCCCSS
jgi:hypothetical protein